MTASEKPNIVHLTYNCEDNSWWAESEQLPGLFAGGDSLDEAKELAWQAVRDEFGDDIAIFDWMPSPAELEPVIASKGANALQAPTIPEWAASDLSPSVNWTIPEPTAT